jgi:hypothetical protein
LTITTKHQVAERGLVTGGPIRFDWRWYYHLPSLAFWTLVLVPLVLLKENRQLQAWAILPALLVVMLGSRMLANLLSLPPDRAEGFVGFVGTLATGWAMVWLLGAWLAGRAVGSRSAWSLAVIVAVSVLWTVANSGEPGPWLSDAVPYAVAGGLMLAAMTLASRFAGHRYAPGRFMAWLVLGMALLPALLAIPAAILFAVANASREVLLIGFGMMITGVVAGGLVYLINLPFMLMAFRTPLYRQRLCRMWRLEEPVAADVPTVEM